MTAEGVERVEQLAMLLPHRAISLQGYLFSRPVSASDLLPLLERLPAHCQELKQTAQKLPAAEIRDPHGRKAPGLAVAGRRLITGFLLLPWWPSAP